MHVALPFVLLIGAFIMSPQATVQSGGGGSVTAAAHTDRSDAPFTLPPQKAFTVSLQKTDSSRDLFAPHGLFGRRRAAGQTPRRQIVEQPFVIQEPKVVCGMTLFPADASYDPGIRISTGDDSRRFTIKRLSPTICK